MTLFRSVRDTIQPVNYRHQVGTRRLATDSRYYVCATTPILTMGKMTMSKMKDTKKMATLKSFADIPPFTSEAEEREFWATHEMGDEILDKAKPLVRGELPPPRPRTRPVAMRFDESTIQRLRIVANKPQGIPDARA